LKYFFFLMFHSSMVINFLLLICDCISINFGLFMLKKQVIFSCEHNFQYFMAGNFHNNCSYYLRFENFEIFDKVLKKLTHVYISSSIQLKEIDLITVIFDNYSELIFHLKNRFSYLFLKYLSFLWERAYRNFSLIFSFFWIRLTHLLLISCYS
jgi:hypothetical protein